MDPTVPKSAAFLLDFIGNKEAPKGYGVVYGNKQNKLHKKLTEWTIGEIINAKPTFHSRHGSSACGRYQFMRDTLKSLVQEGACKLSDVLTPDLQDRLGYHLLRRRGFNSFMSGKIGRTEFGKRLAMEWASFPVLAPVVGGQGFTVKRGQSYYAGDGLNKALVSADDVERALDKVKALGVVPAAPSPKPVPMPAARPEGLVAPPLEDDDGDSPIDVLEDRAQAALKAIGYHEVGMVGTEWGSRSKDTLLAWKGSWNRRNATDQIELDDTLSEDIVERIERDEHRPISEARANATVEDLPPEKQKDINRGSFWSKLLMGFGFGGAATKETGLLDQAESWSYGWVRIRSIYESVGDVIGDFWPLALLAVGVALWFYKNSIKDKDLKLVREGKLMN